jgi:RND family efflux transporter MFP subunit
VGIFALVGCQQSELTGELNSESRTSAKAALRLSEDAQTAIGLATQEVPLQPVQESIQTTGWLTLKPGNESVIKAAATGFVMPLAGEQQLGLGTTVAREQQIGSLQAVVSPHEEAQLIALKVEAEILIRQSLATLQAAEARYQRVKELAAEGIVSGKEEKQVKETLERAKAAYEEARDQLPFLPSEPFEQPLRVGVLAIESPMSGRVTQLNVRPGQFVVQGDPLWTVADWSSLWLRVPVFEGDLPRIDQTKPVRVTVPGVESDLDATPTGVPHSTEDGRRTIDLFYELANADLALRPGQALSVALPTGEAAARVVVPASAVVWDGTGSAWVYVKEDTRSFRRKNVQIGPSLGESVVVERGLMEGQHVVTVGAEALYGEEFKSQTPLEDDDD